MIVFFFSAPLSLYLFLLVCFVLSTALTTSLPSRPSLSFSLPTTPTNLPCSLVSTYTVFQIYNNRISDLLVQVTTNQPISIELYVHC